MDKLRQYLYVASARKKVRDQNSFSREQGSQSPNKGGGGARTGNPVGVVTVEIDQVVGRFPFVGVDEGFGAGMMYDKVGVNRESEVFVCDLDHRVIAFGALDLNTGVRGM